MTFKCVVCFEKKEYFPYNPLIQGKTMRVCSQECYHIFCAEYAACELDVSIGEIEKRLKDYKRERRNE